MSFSEAAMHRPEAWSCQADVTYDFHSLEFGTEPGIVAELTLAHTSPREVFGEAADRRYKGRLATFTHAGIGAGCIIR